MEVIIDGVTFVPAELTASVRRRLGPDAGVTKQPNRYRFVPQALQSSYEKGWNEHAIAVADAAVPIDGDLAWTVERIAELEQENAVLRESQKNYYGQFEPFTDRIKELEQQLAEAQAEVERLKNALLDFVKQYPNSPWIHKQVEQAIRAEIDK